jgi:membrane protein required for colicin V production
MHFTLFDIITLAIITISSMLGLYSGIIRLSINLIAFVASIAGAYLLYPFAEGFLEKYITNRMVLSVSSGILSYIISLILSSLLSSKICSLVENISGGLIDRLLGFAAGVVRGSIICILSFIIIAILTSKSYIGATNLADILKNIDHDQYPIWLKNSLATEYLDHAASKLIPLIPQETMQSLKIPDEPKPVGAMELLDKAHKHKESYEDNSPPLDDNLKKEIDKMIEQ